MAVDSGLGEVAASGFAPYAYEFLTGNLGIIIEINNEILPIEINK